MPGCVCNDAKHQGLCVMSHEEVKKLCYFLVHTNIMTDTTSKFVDSSDDIKAICAESGVAFKLFTNSKAPILRGDTRKQDPDVVYFVEKKHYPSEFLQKSSAHYLGHFDALALKGANILYLDYGHYTKILIRQWILNDDDPCDICLEKTRIADVVNCKRCIGRVCLKCCLKMNLTEDNIARFRDGGEMRNKCPSCREPADTDIWSMYFRVLDALDEFSDYQRGLIELIRDNDPNLEAKLSELQKMERNKRTQDAKSLKPGKIIVIKGLKKKKEWNEKKAKIIGKRVLKNHVIRWPIEMLDGSESKALIKQCNLHKL